MDNVHRPAERDEISEKIHLKSYFEQFRNDLSKVRPEKVVDYRQLSRRREKLLVEGIPEDVYIVDEQAAIYKEAFEEIEEMCSIDSLTVEGECPPMKVCLDDDESAFANSDVRKFQSTPISQEGKSKLKTLAYLDRATEEETRKRILNLRNFNDIWFEAAPKPPAKLKSEIIENAVVVTVRIYRPIKNSPRQPVSSFRYVQEIVLLGTNTLSDLRDLIKCPVDYMIHDDVSEAPFEVVKNPLTGRVEKSWDSKKKNKEVYKSGFIYIEGCFYNDMRWPEECIDYSEVIRDWASHPKRLMDPFETAKMEETCIEDLTIRFGYPYVYVHQGDHEHLVSFLDARLASEADPQIARKYPYERSVGMAHSKYCIVCNNRVAKWVTSGNERVPEDPFFFCDECFQEFNYDENGKKICDFKAYNYIEPNAL